MTKRKLLTYNDLLYLEPDMRADQMWTMLLAKAGSLHYPEARLAFDDSIRFFLSSIKRTELRQHYQAWVREKRAEMFLNFKNQNKYINL